jgi:hypothetical protein
MKKLDFVTVTYNDEREINLLKLQASSFSFVDMNIINNIIIIFNDNKNLNEGFKEKFYNEIIHYYPNTLIEKIKLLFLEDLGLDFEYSNWFTQQLIKLEVSKYVSSDYYVVLDGKNHFMNNITIDYFFNDNNIPYLYFNCHNEKMLEFYYNSLSYFDVKCPCINNNNFNEYFKLQTTTPFLFITEECKNMISYVERKEQTCFKNFFIGSMKFTEFFLYYAYLVFSNKYLLYEYTSNLHPIVTVGPQDPNTHYYNTWDYKQNTLENNKIYVFSLHRQCFNILDNSYKENLLDFYKNTYKDLKIIELIEQLFK